MAMLLGMGYAAPQAVNRIRSSSKGALPVALLPVEERLLEGATLGQAVFSAGGFPAILERGLNGLADIETLAALRRLADLLEETDGRQVHLAAMLAYPRLLFAFGIVMIWWLLGPGLHLTTTHLIFWQPLPPMARYFHAVSNFVSSSDGALLGAALLALVQFGLSGRFGMSRGWPVMPWVGAWMRREDSVTWCLWMDHLLRNRTPMAEAMRVAADSCVSKTFVDRMHKAASRVSRGARMIDALAAEQALPPSAGWLVAYADNREYSSGTLRWVANCLQRSMRTATNDLDTVLEPLALVVLGTLVAVCVVSVLAPEFLMIGGIY
jgi:type II secretory pathway component PulF